MNHASIPKEVFELSLRSLLNPIISMLDDKEVSEILINGPDEVYVERKGCLELTHQKFEDEYALISTAQGIAQYVGRSINAEHPRLDARLPDGSRVHIIMPPAARDGIHIAIRKFSSNELSIQKLIEWESLSKDAAELLQQCVSCKQNIVVAGATGSGKTSLLNVLSTLIGAQERIIVIEDSSELQLLQPHVVYLEGQPGNSSVSGGISIRELFWSSLRLRPDRIIIGELRGAESLDLVQAMTSGHAGSMTTTHATYPDDTLRRIETMALMSDISIPHNILREQIASAIQFIVQTSRFNDGTRGITHISEVVGLEQNNYVLQHCYLRKMQRQKDGRIKAELYPTGYKPSFQRI